MRRVAALVVLFVVGCGKHAVHEDLDKPWVAPTPENGFRAVVQDACVKIDAAGKIQNTLSGSVEDVPATNARVVATDDRFVYWADGKVIHRAERGTSPWPKPWTTDLEVVSELPIADLAVTEGRIYWVGETTTATTKTQTLFWVEKSEPRFAQELIPKINAPISKLVARGSSLIYAVNDSSNEISDTGERWPLGGAGNNPSPVVAVDEHAIYTYSRGGFISAQPRRHPWMMGRSLAAAEDPVDMVSDGTFVYWLERGPETPADEDCERCSTGYRMKGQPQRALGKLRRVPVAGGAPSDLYVGLPNVESLTIARGKVWISTRQGLLRYDPTCHLPPARVAPTAGLHGRAVPFGEALVALGSSPQPRVVLLGSP